VSNKDSEPNNGDYQQKRVGLHISTLTLWNGAQAYWSFGVSDPIAQADQAIRQPPTA